MYYSVKVYIFRYIKFRSVVKMCCNRTPITEIMYDNKFNMHDLWYHNMISIIQIAIQVFWLFHKWNVCVCKKHSESVYAKVSKGPLKRFTFYGVNFRFAAYTFPHRIGTFHFRCGKKEKFKMIIELYYVYHDRSTDGVLVCDLYLWVESYYETHWYASSLSDIYMYVSIIMKNARTHLLEFCFYIYTNCSLECYLFCITWNSKN